jgi:hypothetical protein
MGCLQALGSALPTRNQWPITIGVLIQALRVTSDGEIAQYQLRAEALEKCPECGTVLEFLSDGSTASVPTAP